MVNRTIQVKVLKMRKRKIAQRRKNAGPYPGWAAELYASAKSREDGWRAVVPERYSLARERIIDKLAEDIRRPELHLTIEAGKLTWIKLFFWNDNCEAFFIRKRLTIYHKSNLFVNLDRALTMYKQCPEGIHWHVLGTQ